MNIKHSIIFSFLIMITISSCLIDPLDDDKDNTIFARDLVSIDEATTLTNHRDGVDYIVKDRVDVRAALTIDAGVEIQFEEGTYISVHSNGSLSANGTAASNIIMTNTGVNFANWAGLEINSTSPSNILNYCVISYAGDGEAFGVFNDEFSAITLSGGRVKMDNCTVEKSGGHGFMTVSSLEKCIISSFENNRFIDNSAFPILVHQDYIKTMNLTSCVYTNNQKNMIGIRSSDGDRLYEESTWKNLEVPYYVQEGFELYEGLTIEAGAELVFANNAFLYASYGYLTIQGTQSNHVVLRGAEALINFWEGVRIDHSSAKNIFEFTDISDGGSDADFSANIVLYSNGTNLTINNCTSARSGSCDVLLDDFLGTPVLTNNSPEITEVCEQ